MSEKIIMEIYMPACHICGVRHWKNVSVMGAKGYYCANHTWSTVLAVRACTAGHIQRDWDRGVVRIPSAPMYDPLEVTNG